jgi:Ca-activated chloride channel family protein
MMEIGNPLALYFLLVAVAGGLLFVYEIVSTKQAMATFADSAILSKVVKGYSRRRRILKRMLVVIALVLLVLGWAMPRVGRGTRIVKREGADVVIALDVSVSMYAEDVSPNRMEVAKRTVRTLISRLGEDRFALVGFAGEGFIHCPLTIDSGALAMFVDFLNPGVVPEQGTNIGSAITESLAALKTSSGRGKAIVLITDGEDHGHQLEEAIKMAQADGVRIYALGVGTPAGEPIPVRDRSGTVTSYKRDESDEVVVSRLDTALLKRIAGATGGESYTLGLGDKEIAKVARSIEGIEKGVLEQRTYEDYAEMFQIPLLLCFVLLVVEGFMGDKVRRA